MTAVDLKKLNIKIADLKENFNSPILFVRKLYSILDFYSNHTHIKNQYNPMAPNIKVFRTSPQVLKVIENELSYLIHISSEHSIKLAEQLWSETYYELKKLAIFIFGQLPLEFTDELIVKYIDWFDNHENLIFIDDIANTGLKSIRKANPNLLIKRTEKWLDSDNIRLKLLGFHILKYLIKEEEFKNIPAIFNLLNPYLRQADESLRIPILEITSLLAHRSPAEMAFELQNNYKIYHQEFTAWLIRRSNMEFPENLKKTLKDTLHE